MDLLKSLQKAIAKTDTSRNLIEEIDGVDYVRMSLPVFERRVRGNPIFFKSSHFSFLQNKPVVAKGCKVYLADLEQPNGDRVTCFTRACIALTFPVR